MKETDPHIGKITPLFLQYGIKSVSMDDIAAELGISKKTLYHIYKDKTELVKKTLEEIKAAMELIIEDYMQSDSNAIEKEIEQRKKYSETFRTLKPSFIYDLKKFYPDMFSEFRRVKSDFIRRSTASFISEGQKQGLLREDIDAEFMSKLSITLFSSMFYPEIQAFTESDLASKTYSDQFFIYHMNGICSEKGRHLFNELFKDKLL